MPAAASWPFGGSHLGCRERRDLVTFPLAWDGGPWAPRPRPLPPTLGTPPGCQPLPTSPSFWCFVPSLQQRPGQCRAWHCLCSSGTAHTSNLTAGSSRSYRGRHGSAWPAHTCHGVWHNGSEVPVLGAPLPPGMPGGFGHCGHHLPRGFPPGQSTGQGASPQPGRPGAASPAARRLLCAGTWLRSAGRALLRAGGSRGLPGPRARPAALTAAARRGWRTAPHPASPPPSSPPCPRCREGLSRSGCLRPPCC